MATKRSRFLKRICDFENAPKRFKSLMGKPTCEGYGCCFVILKQRLSTFQFFNEYDPELNLEADFDLHPLLSA